MFHNSIQSEFINNSWTFNRSLGGYLRMRVAKSPLALWHMKRPRCYYSSCAVSKRKIWKASGQLKPVFRDRMTLETRSRTTGSRVILVRSVRPYPQSTIAPGVPLKLKEECMYCWWLICPIRVDWYEEPATPRTDRHLLCNRHTELTSTTQVIGCP